MSTIPVTVGQTYTLVAKVDYAADTVSLWVNPDINATEAANTPAATATYTGTQWSTAIRIASGGSGISSWDDLTCATTWQSLRTYEVTTSTPTGVGSLQEATLNAGSTGGRITFPHAGAVYAVRGVLGGQNLIRFGQNTLGSLTLDIPITGLGLNEQVRGIDFRTEGNGLLYALCIREIPGEDNDVGRLCILNTTTGALTNVGSVSFRNDLSNGEGFSGFDFEYRKNFEFTETAIRLTSLGGRNYSLSVITGFLEYIGSPTTNSTAITGLASDVWTGRDAASTVYGIDLNTANPALWRIGGSGGIPSADNGIATRIGSLNLPGGGSTINGFDIAENGSAYLTEIRSVGLGTGNFLHSVDLKTGATRQIGEIGSGLGFLYGLSVASSKIVANNLGEGPREIIFDGSSHGGSVRIGFSTVMNLDMDAGDAVAFRNIQFEDTRGINQNGGLLTAKGCTFYRCNNSAIRNAGGILRLERCTFFENISVNGGALFVNGDSARVKHCTIVNNSATSTGGGIQHSFGSLELSACIVAQNTTASGLGPDVGSTGGLTATACVIGNAANSTITETVANRNDAGSTGDLVDPSLAPLAHYGGFTWTMPPLYRSTALARALTTNFTGDQRGFPINGSPDSGAAEYRGYSDLLLYWNTDWDDDGMPYGTEVATLTNELQSDPENLNRFRLRYDNDSPVMTFRVIPDGLRNKIRWVVKRSTDLEDFSEIIYSFDGATDDVVVAPGIFRGSEGSLILLRDNPPNPSKAFYRLEAVLSP